LSVGSAFRGCFAWPNVADIFHLQRAPDGCLASRAPRARAGDDGAPSSIGWSESDGTAIDGALLASVRRALTVPSVACCDRTSPVVYERTRSHSATPNEIVSTVKNAGRNPIFDRAIDALTIMPSVQWEPARSAV